MICEFCGNELRDGATECPACGAQCGGGYSAPPEENLRVQDDYLCAYCGQIVPGDAKTCPNCGMVQYCFFCGKKLPEAANNCPECETKTPAFKKQVAWLERRNFSKWKWLILGLIALGILGWAAYGFYCYIDYFEWYCRKECFHTLSRRWSIACALLAISLAPFYLFFLRIFFIKKETDGKSIVSMPGYWKNRFPADLIERQNETKKPQRMGVFKAVGLRHWIIGGCLLAAVFVIFGIGNAYISSRRQIAKERRIAEAQRLVKQLMNSLVHCPAGSFTMGSPSGGSYRNNETQHRVTLTEDFYIGKYEVTQAQYEAVMGNNPSYFKGDDRPVEDVSWHDAMKFCEKLNELTAGKRPAGYKFTLPTEAQWEYACRAGSTGAYAGNLDSMGWHYCNSGDKTHNVGQKRPNAWGIYDMHGNVWEWCLDWYGDYTGDATDPEGPYSGSYRVIRGGGWDEFTTCCRSAFRFNFGPDSRFDDLGFRVALVHE